MVFPEQELPVEVAGLNSIHVNLHMQIMSVLRLKVKLNKVATGAYHMNVGETCQNQCFQQLTANSTGPHTQYFGSFDLHAKTRM